MKQKISRIVLRIADDYWLLILSLLAILFIVLKWCTMTITHDEATTYLYVVRFPRSDIFHYTTPLAANNHLLNTLLIKISTWMFWLSEFTVRIPALLGGVLYIVSSYLIARTFIADKKIIAKIGLFFLLSNPFLLDFLVVARGYALWLWCMMLWMYFTILFLKSENHKRLKYVIGSMLFFSLSALANLSFLNVFLSNLGVLLLVWFQKYFVHSKKIKNIRSIFWCSVIFSIILFLIYNQPIKHLSAWHDLYFWWSTWFWADTVNSLVTQTLYLKEYSPYVSIFIKILVVFFFIFWGYITYQYLQSLYFKKIKDYLSNISMVRLFLVICILSVVLQHILLWTLFVVERGALFFVPIFYLLILFIFDYAYKYLVKYVSYVKTLGIVMILFISIHLINSLQLHYVPIWKYDLNTRSFMTDYVIKNEDQLKKFAPVILGINWLFEPSINFYILMYNLTGFVAPVDRSWPFKPAHLYYLNESGGDWGYNELSQKVPLTVLWKYPDSNTYVAVIKQ